MLKALIQLFAEKFLQSKKQWVSGQAFPESRIELSSTTRGYVAPADGYFCIFHSGGSGGNMLFDLDARTATGTPPSNRLVRDCRVLHGDTFLGSFVPVKKGMSVYLTTDTVTEQVWFCPTTGWS